MLLLCFLSRFVNPMLRLSSSLTVSLPPLCCCCCSLYHDNLPDSFPTSPCSNCSPPLSPTSPPDFCLLHPTGKVMQMAWFSRTCCEKGFKVGARQQQPAASRADGGRSIRRLFCVDTAPCRPLASLKIYSIPCMNYPTTRTKDLNTSQLPVYGVLYAIPRRPISHTPPFTPNCVHHLHYQIPSLSFFYANSPFPFYSKPPFIRSTYPCSRISFHSHLQHGDVCFQTVATTS